MPAKKTTLWSPEDARRELATLPAWTLSEDGKSIRRELVLEDFLAAVELIGHIASAAEAMDHHPDLHLTHYRRLAVELSTHDEGGLTDKDFALACRIEALPRREKAR